MTKFLNESGFRRIIKTIKNALSLKADKSELPLLVTYTGSQCDTSIADIYAAFLAGRDVEMNYGYMFKLSLVQCSEEGAIFSANFGDQSIGIKGTISNGVDTWEFSLVDLQERLTSGTNIKTVAGNSLLGSGNVTLNDSDIYHSGEDGEDGNYIDDGDTVDVCLNNLDTAVASKQNTLVSGTNIKTVNNNSLLGSGNISIEPNEIASITTTESTASGGNNTVTITETDGTTTTFNVKNGKDGADGVSLGEIALVQTTGSGTDVVMSQNAVTEYGRKVTTEDLAGTSDWIKAKLTEEGWELGKYIYRNTESSNANYCITHYIPINNIVGHSLTWDIGVATNQIKVAFYTAEGTRTGYVDGATSSSTSRTITIASSGTGSATNATQLRMSLALNNLPQCYIFDNTTGEYIFRADEYISNLCKGSNLPYGVFEDNLLAQGKGDSTFKTMSQKAITDAINYNVNIERGTSVQMNGGVYTKLNSYQVATLNNSDTMSMQFLIYGGDMSNGTQDWRYLYFGPVGINGNNTDYSTYFTFKCTCWGCPYLFSRANNNTSTCLGQMTGNQTPHPVVATIVLNRLTGNVRYYRGTDLIIEETSNDYKCAKFVADSGLFYFHGGDHNARFYGVQLYDCDIMRWQLHYSPYKDMLNSACQSEISAPFINTYNQSHDFEFIVGGSYNAASYNFSYNGNTITQTRKDGLAGLFYVENYQATHVSFISRAVFTIDKSFYLYNMGNACTLLDSNGNILEERISGTGTTTYPAGTYTLIGYIDFGSLGITTKENGATLVYTRERRFSGAVAHFNFNALYDGNVYDNVSNQFYTFYSNNSCTTVSTNPSISQLPLRGVSITNITIPHYKGEIKLDSTYGKVYIANSDYTWKQINNS